MKLAAIASLVIAVVAAPIACAQDAGLPPPPAVATSSASAPFARLSYADGHMKIALDQNGALHVEGLAVPNDGAWDGRASADELRAIFDAFRAADVARLEQRKPDDGASSTARERRAQIEFRPTDGASDVERLASLADPDEWKRTTELAAVLRRVAERVAAPQAAKRHEDGRTKRAWREISVNITKRDAPRTVKIDADGAVQIIAENNCHMVDPRHLTDAELLRLDAALAKADVPTLPEWTSRDLLEAQRTSSVEIKLGDGDRTSAWRGSLGKAQSIARLRDLLVFFAGLGEDHGMGTVARLAPWNYLEVEFRGARDAEVLTIASDGRAWLGADRGFEGRLTDLESKVLDHDLEWTDLKTRNRWGDAYPGQPNTVKFQLKADAEQFEETHKLESAKTRGRTCDLYRLTRAIADRLKKERDAAATKPKSDSPSAGAKTPGLAGAVGK